MPRPTGELRRIVSTDTTYRAIRTGLETGRADVARWHIKPVRPGARLRTKQPHSWRVDYAGNGKRPCSEPVTIFLTGRPMKKGKAIHTVSVDAPESIPQLVEMQVPCRKCENCLRRRSAHWRMRAIAVVKQSNRTWFGTLTLNPDQHFRVAAACRIAAARNGDDFDMFPPERQFAERHRCISREITLYLKRLRKYSGAEIKFLCVVEAHKTGLPHYHMLVHEVKAAPHVRHKLLTAQWRVGFSQWKLVTEDRQVSYVTKYLAKSMQARVRASIDYQSTT